MNKLSKVLTTVLVATGLLIASCSTVKDIYNGGGGVVTDQAITLATSEALQHLSAARAHVVANYIDYAATQIRAINGVPTTQQFLALLLQYVPANIKSGYPELVAFVSNEVANYYSQALAKYGSNATTLYAFLSRMASDLEAGAALYVAPGAKVTTAKS